MKLLIRHFRPADQATVKALILEGLGEHFGRINPNLNPDLNDIDKTYIQPGHRFLVAELGSEIVGTAALTQESPGVGRIVRVTVKPDHRRAGIGRTLIKRVIEIARERGDTRLLVETNCDWDDAIRLYQRCGFVEYDRNEEEVHFALDLI